MIGCRRDRDLLRYTRTTSIVGDILKIRAHDVGLGDMALVEMPDGEQSLAQAIQLDGDEVSLQVFGGGEGLSTQATVRFLGHPTQVTYSPNILGRVFRGDGEPMDGGPNLSGDRQVDSGGPSVNPVTRVVPTQMIRTKVPMIDVFNCLVESQKIPIFSVAGEPYNQLLARIAIQADADIIAFGGLGLIFDDYWFFRTRFEDEGIFSRTVMFVNLASDPIVERVLTPDLVLKVAERFAVEEHKRVLVLMTDMTAYADALKEIGISMERVPSNRGYIGDLYSQLAVRYERACSYKGAGSVTILTVTTMPGNDVTHPVPDNTGYITEGQFYLHDGMIDPFGSLSRLKHARAAPGSPAHARAGGCPGDESDAGHPRVEPTGRGGNRRGRGEALRRDHARGYQSAGARGAWRRHGRAHDRSGATLPPPWSGPARGWARPIC